MALVISIPYYGDASFRWKGINTDLVSNMLYSLLNLVGISLHKELFCSKSASAKLSWSFLEALEKPKETEKRFGTPINFNILQRFENILLKGMEKEEREQILKDLCFPENGKLMQAPKLNIELTGLLTSAMKLTDTMLEERQEDTGFVIATICNTIDMLTKPKFDNLTIVKNVYV